MDRYRVGRLDELHSVGRLIVDIRGRAIGVFAVDGELYALRSQCPHQGGPLCEGRVTDALKARVVAGGRPQEYYDGDQKVICCPWHGIEFDLRTGICLGDPGQRVRTYEVVVEDADVYVLA